MDRVLGLRGMGTYPMRSSTESNFTDYNNLNLSSGYLSDSDMRVISSRCEVQDGYMSENDSAALYHRLHAHRGIPSVGTNLGKFDQHQLAGFTSNKFRNNSPLLVREGEKVSDEPVELSSSDGQHPKTVRLLNGSNGGGREGAPPPQHREGPPAPHQVVYRVVSSRHVKKSDSSQQTETSAFRQTGSGSQWKGGGQNDPRLRDKQRSGGGSQPMSQQVPQSMPPSAPVPIQSNGITHRSKTDKKRMPSSGSRDELESELCNGGEKVVRNGMYNGSTGKVVSSSGKAKTRDASASNAPPYNYTKRPQTNGTTKEQRPSQPISRTKVKVSGGTQTESGYSSRGPAIGSVGKVGPAPSGGIGSNISASGRFLPPDYAERDFVDSAVRTPVSGREYSDDGSARGTPSREYAEPRSTRTMPDYAELSPYSSGWLRHASPYTAHSLPTRSSASGVLVEADSIESLPAQLQHRASLTHSRILGAASTAPRISRSNSIRSTKSEKLYPSMLERSDETEPYYSIPYSLGHSQPTSPTPTHLSRFNYPISPVSTGSSGVSRPPHQYPNKLSNKDDDVHGSAVSLVSTASSLYSTAEEKQAHEVRKLRKELNESQEKVQTLTQQLSTNAHVVSAFEQSLSNMTQRLEKKDCELIELRQTIELLRQAQCQQECSDTASRCSDPSAPPAPRRHTLASEPDQPISRQLSTDSVSSLSSTCSLSSNNHHIDSADKKKKRGWLRSSFNKAFSRTKKNKSGGSVDGGDDPRGELSSAPPSPLLPHHPLSQDHSPVSSSPHPLLADKEIGHGESVDDLKKQLREKDMVLTDIRLEALSSAHQLESLKDTVLKMRNEMHSLKQDNERLQRLVTSKSLTSSQSSLTRNSGDDTIDRRFSMNDAISGGDVKYDLFCGDPDGKRVVVSVLGSGNGSEPCTSCPIATVSVSGKIKWDMLDAIIRRLFKDYLERIDPSGSLGLSIESLLSYEIGEVIRCKDSPVPELLPCGYLVGDNLTIALRLRGPADNSLDSLVFETLVPKSILQRYVSLMTEYRRIILCGPSGTGKTYLANKLAEYLAIRAEKPTPEAIATFNVETKSSKELRQYLTHVGEQCESEGGNDLPSVIILDNLHQAGPLQEVFQGFLQARLTQNQPYIIGTMAQTTSHTTNLQLHHNFRWILCANHMEPVKGLLGRYLRRREIEAGIKSGSSCPELARLVDWLPRVWSHLNTFLESHSTCDVTLGPRLFLQCPMDPHASQVWFTDLWNYSIVPYAVDAVREGLQNYGKRSQFQDPTSYLLQTYPWSHKHNQPLIRLRPEDVGYEPQPNSVITSNSLKSTGGAPDCLGDPLMNMVMRLQEAANYSGPQNNDSDSNANSDTLDSTDFDPTL